MKKQADGRADHWCAEMHEAARGNAGLRCPSDLIRGEMESGLLRKTGR